MDRPTGAVLKRQEVRQAGSSPAAAPAMPACPAAGACGSSAARARIVQQSSGGAVIEVTCSCGKKIVLDCQYDAGGPAGPQT